MRIIDILLSGAALLMFLPFGIIIAIIQKFSGEGDIFYQQKRLGKDLKPFHVLKFATMLRNSPKIGTGMISVRNDPRVFPFGRFLRLSKLNEVPQLLNVLCGDMGIVGPRPMVSSDIEILPPDVQRKVYSVRPGLTGVGSIVFRDEEKILSVTKKPLRQCYCEDIAPLKAEIELWYVNNRSFVLDCKIIFITAWVIAFPSSVIYQKIFDSSWSRFSEKLSSLQNIKTRK